MAWRHGEKEYLHTGHRQHLPSASVVRKCVLFVNSESAQDPSDYL
jgi:hypothetical protein